MNGKSGFFLIVDYNLSRGDDVRAVSVYVRRRYNLKTILVRARATAADAALCDIVVEGDPKREDFLERTLRSLRPYRNALTGGVVFSDDAVYAGALLLERLGLPTDDSELAQGAASKAIYRERESSLKAFLGAQGVLVPDHLRVRTMEDAAAFAARNPAGFVLKPSCEGNNRGVVVVRPGDDLHAALREVEPHAGGGLLCEEYIPFEREFSYDGVGAATFITEKVSADGRYPVETAQLLPAAVTDAERGLLERAGLLANLIVGQRRGAFHNEIKLSRDGRRAAIVEPNRRPGGMRIWQLARRVYGVNLFEQLVDAALGAAPRALPEPRGFAATIMLEARCDGRFRRGEGGDIFARITARLREKGLLSPEARSEWFDFAWLGEDAEREVRAVPRDNGDFIARVCFASEERPRDARGFVRAVQDEWRAQTAYLIAQALSA